MRRIVWLLAFLAMGVSALFGQATRPAHIRIGDELTVYVYGATDMTGTFAVQSDGAIYVPRAGHVVVNGLTADAAQVRLLAKLRNIFTDPVATISIKSQRASAVYVVGGKEGFLPLTSETDLRQVYAASKPEGDPDLLQVSVFRNGAKIASLSATDLTSGRDDAFNGPLQPNDLVVFEPKPFIRVWVIGTVRSPGRIRLTAGEDVYQAIAQAGDLAPATTSGTGQPTQLRTDYVVNVRRGPEVLTVPLVPDPAKPPLKLESGDTVSVQPPRRIRVTLTGEAKAPGEVYLQPGTTLATAVSAAGGADAQGSLRNVVLFHQGEATFHNIGTGTNLPASAPASGSGANVLSGPTLEDGDVVFVPRNERAFYVYGSVNRIGRVIMADDRTYRLSDAVAEAGGATSNGTLTRVSLGRPGPDGRLVITTYRLDKFIKSGDASNNPLVQPGDVVYVDSSKGINAGTVITALSAALLLDSIRRL